MPIGISVPIILAFVRKLNILFNISLLVFNFVSGQSGSCPLESDVSQPSTFRCASPFPLGSAPVSGLALALAASHG